MEFSAMYSIDDFINEAKKQLEDYTEQRTNLQNLVSENKQRHTELKKEIAAAYGNLLNLVMPSITEENLRVLSQTINAPRVATMWGTMKEVEQKLQKIINQFEKDEEVKTSAALLEPHTGVLTSQLEELEALYPKIKSEFDELSSNYELKRLIEAGYGTDNYKHRGFTKYINKEYLRDWKTGDYLVERFKVNSFVDISFRYSELAEQERTFRESIASLHEQIENVQQKSKSYNQALLQKKELIGDLYSQVGREVSLFLQNGGEKAKNKLKNANEVLKLIPSIEGMLLKQDYLEKLNDKIANDITELNQRADVLRSEKNNYEKDQQRSRSKTFTNEQFAHRFRNDHYSKVYNRYNTVSNSIYVFNDYNNFSTFDEFLYLGLVAGQILGDGGHYNSGQQEYFNDNTTSSYSTNISDYSSSLTNSQYSTEPPQPVYDRGSSSSDTSSGDDTSSNSTPSGWSDAS